MEENPLEGWTVKSVDGQEVSAQEREQEVVQEQIEDNTIKVNLDQPEPEAEVVEEVQEPVAEEVVEEIKEDETQQELPESGESSEEDSLIELITDDEPSSEGNEPVEAGSEAVQGQVEVKQELPEGIDKLVKFMDETGGSLEDYLRLNKKIEDLEPVDTIMEAMARQKPHLSRDEIEFLMEEKFLYNEDDDPREIKRKQLAFKEELYDSQKFLKQQKDNYYADLKFNRVAPEFKEAYEFHNKYKESEKQSEELAAKFRERTDQVFNQDFKGFDFKVGDNKYRFKVNEPAKVKEYQSDFTNFVNEFTGEDGSITDAAGYHKALFAAKNADKIAQHFYEQGRADAIKQSNAKAKNIDMKPRTDATSVKTKNGTTFKVVNEDSNTFKLNLKHY